MDSVNVRNLEQIQEEESRPRVRRLGALLLASLGGVALVVASVVGDGKSGGPARSQVDPLASLVAESKSRGEAPEKLDGKDVTFPSILSDELAPTTALAAVKDERGRLIEQGLPASDQPLAELSLPPPAGDKLSVLPLAAGTLLSATSVTNVPKDDLVQLAAEASKASHVTEPALPGSAEGFQIQVASFKDQADADRFVDELRKRGHRAFRQPAYVHNRGLWHRVRVGPFKNKFEATQYKRQFERTERVSPFVIDPEKAKQGEGQRGAARAPAD
jgi:DedD protein